MMRQYLLFISFILLVTNSLFSQNWNDIFYMETDADYALEEKNYEKALDIYQRILKKVPESALIKFKIGLTYLKTDDQQHLAINYLEQAAKDVAKDFDSKSISETRAPIEAHLYLGFAYQITGKLSEALTSYKNYKDLVDSSSPFYSLVNQYIASCSNAENQFKSPRNIKITNLGELINNKFSNFNAVISGDDNTLAYTSYTANYIDLFVAKKSGNGWGKPQNVTDQVSKKYYLKTCGISYDGTVLYLATDDPVNNDLFQSTYDGSAWTNAKKMDKVFNTKSNETHASASKDGNTVYFTSDRPGGLGGLDIYKSTKDEKGKWGPAINLGSKINTSLNEETPFVTSDGNYLFFSSQGHNSIGGYDVFYTDLAGDQEITNIGYPLNTTGNDLFYVPGDNLQKGYMARFETSSLGKKDIYQVDISREIILKGIIIGPEELAQTETQYSIVLINKETNKTVNTIISSEPEFSYNISPGNYAVTILNDKCSPYSQDVLITQDYSKSEFPVEAILTLIPEPEPQVAEVVEAAEIIPEIIPEAAPVIQQEIAVVAPVVEPPVVQEQLIEEPKVIDEPKEQIIEEQISIIHEPEPELEIIEKPVEISKPKPTVVFENIENSKKSYSVQLMALKKPVDTDYFKGLENVVVTLGKDGFYRYTIGYTVSYAEASRLKEKINQAGYPSAFIKTNAFILNYTIQLMALKAPVDLSYFKDLPIVSVTKGADEFYRYTFGAFDNINAAKEALQKLRELGYDKVFIRKMEKELNLASN
jgi:tetratricopeptide (TPR) repeat protein/cell division septation protein DedD